MSECDALCQWLNRSNADLTTMSCTGIARGLSLYYNLCNAKSALLKRSAELFCSSAIEEAVWVHQRNFQ